MKYQTLFCIIFSAMLVAVVVVGCVVTVPTQSAAPTAAETSAPPTATPDQASSPTDAPTAAPETATSTQLPPTAGPAETVAPAEPAKSAETAETVVSHNPLVERVINAQNNMADYGSFVLHKTEQNNLSFQFGSDLSSRKPDMDLSKSNTAETVSYYTLGNQPSLLLETTFHLTSGKGYAVSAEVRAVESEVYVRYEVQAGSPSYEVPEDWIKVESSEDLAEGTDFDYLPSVIANPFESWKLIDDTDPYYLDPPGVSVETRTLNDGKVVDIIAITQSGEEIGLYDSSEKKEGETVHKLTDDSVSHKAFTIDENGQIIQYYEHVNYITLQEKQGKLTGRITIENETTVEITNINESLEPVEIPDM